MADPTPQSFQRHKRYVPGFHGVTFALVLATCVLAVAQVVRAPGIGSLGGLTGAPRCSRSSGTCGCSRWGCRIA